MNCNPATNPPENASYSLSRFVLSVQYAAIPTKSSTTQKPPDESPSNTPAVATSGELCKGGVGLASAYRDSRTPERIGPEGADPPPPAPPHPPQQDISTLPTKGDGEHQPAHQQNPGNQQRVSTHAERSTDRRNRPRRTSEE